MNSLSSSIVKISKIVVSDNQENNNMKRNVIACILFGCIITFASSSFATIWVSLNTSKKILFQIPANQNDSIVFYNFAEKQTVNCQYEIDSHKVTLGKLIKALPQNDFVIKEVDNSFLFDTSGLDKLYKAQQLKVNVQNNTADIADVIVECKVGDTLLETIDKRTTIKTGTNDSKKEIPKTTTPPVTPRKADNKAPANASPIDKAVTGLSKFFKDLVS